MINNYKVKFKSYVVMHRQNIRNWFISNIFTTPTVKHGITEFHNALFSSCDLISHISAIHLNNKYSMHTVFCDGAESQYLYKC